MSENQLQLIKRYAGHRLYNIATAAYLTLDDLADMVADGKPFLVLDAESNEDITREIMNQLR